jgi:hypothetical protein
MAVAEQQVTAPDQHAPSNRGLARVIGIASIITLLSMTRPFNNHASAIEDFFLFLTAGIIAVLMIGDAVLRRNGLRS